MNILFFAFLIVQAVTKFYLPMLLYGDGGMCTCTCTVYTLFLYMYLSTCTCFIRNIWKCIFVWQPVHIHLAQAGQGSGGGAPGLSGCLGQG